jgi:hypothetical protein
LKTEYYGGHDLGRHKKLINNTNIPQYKVEAIARCIMPDILAFYEARKGRENLQSGNVNRKRKKAVWKGNHRTNAKRRRYREITMPPPPFYYVPWRSFRIKANPLV